MLDTEQIRQALKQVMDPELQKNIVELGMVRDIAIQDGTVHITLALTTLACPLRSQISEDVVSAVQQLDPGRPVQVHLEEMTPAEKQRLIESQTPKGEAAPKPSALVNHIDHVIAVMSGKGGVGKSSVAAMLAVALARAGKRVGLLDGDITGPSIPKMFGLRTPPGLSPLGAVPPQTGAGIAIMSINLLLEDESQAVIWRGPLISSAIQQFWDDVVWGNLDVLVVDLPPGTSDASLTVLQSLPVDGVIMVTSPQDLAGMVVRKAAQMAQRLNVPILGVIENMSYVECPKCGEHIEVFGPSHAEEVAQHLGVSLLGRLPLDPQLARMGDTGAIERYHNPTIDAIAAKLLEMLG